MNTAPDPNPALHDDMHNPLLGEPDPIVSQRIKPSDFAIIDIGSNSVRLVVYAYPQRQPVIKMNVKELVGLGRGLDQNACIQDAAGAHFLELMAQFRLLIEKTGVQNVKAVGTAALRDAANGSDYLRKAQDILGHPIEILSGDGEAHMAAYGILMGWPQAQGVLADLGGGSLELARIADGAVHETATFPLGVLRLREFKNIKKETRARLHLRDLSPFMSQPLFLIGGSWRSLARVELAHNHPFERILHGFELSSKKMASFCSNIQDMSSDDISSLGMLSDNRREDIVFGATLLKILLKELKAPKVTFSAYGLREGVLYGALPIDLRQLNLLDCYVEDRRLRKARDPMYLNELLELLRHLFALYQVKIGDFYDRILRVCAALSDTYWHIHPDHRHEWAFYDALNNPAFAYARKRNLCALVLALRYNKTLNKDMKGLFQTLCEEDQLFCLLLSAILRSVLDTTKGVSGILPEYGFSLVSPAGKVLDPQQVKLRAQKVREAKLHFQSPPHLPQIRLKNLDSIHKSICAFKYHD